MECARTTGLAHRRSGRAPRACAARAARADLRCGRGWLSASRGSEQRERRAKSSLRCTKSRKADAALPVQLLMAVFKFDHLEWGIEKATELGAARITPVLARRTEKHLAQAAAKRAERWRRIVREASQQSRRSDVPQVDEPVPLKAALQNVEADRETAARGDRRREHAARRAGSSFTRGAASRSAIGPEGGWTAEEMGDVSRCRLAACHAGPAHSSRGDRSHRRAGGGGCVVGVTPC